MLAAVPERPKIADAPLSVVLLARPGVEDLHTIVRAWLAWLGQRPGDTELLVVFDDANAETSALAIDDARLRIIHHVAPPGVGPSLQTAIWFARYPLLLTATGDRQFQPDDAQRLFVLIDQVDLVTGCRVAGPPPRWLRALGLVKRILTRIFLGYASERRASWLGWRGIGRRCFVRFFFGVQLHDVECPLRLYRTEMLRRFPIQARGSFAQVEILAKANHLGCWMAEAPVPWSPPAHAEPDPLWKADGKMVRRNPDFGSPAVTENAALPAGVGSRDLIA